MGFDNRTADPDAAVHRCTNGSSIKIEHGPLPIEQMAGGRWILRDQDDQFIDVALSYQDLVEKHSLELVV